MSFAPRNAAVRTATAIPGSFAPARPSITTTSTSSTATSAPCSSSSAPTFPTPPPRVYLGANQNDRPWLIRGRKRSAQHARGNGSRIDLTTGLSDDTVRGLV